MINQIHVKYMSMNVSSMNRKQVFRVVSNGPPFMVMDEVKILHDYTGVPGIGVSTSTTNVYFSFER